MPRQQRQATHRRLRRRTLRIATTGPLLAIFGLVSVGSRAGVAVQLADHGDLAGPLVVVSGAVGTAPDASTANQASSFSIVGSVAGLYPGKSLPLVLTVSNSEKVPVTLTSISITVNNASAGCIAANVTVTSFSGHLVVAAGKTAKVTVQVKMAHSAPNACQGAHFPFHYSGLATVA